MGKPLANQGIGSVLSGFTLLARHSHSYCRMLQESSCLPLGSQQRPLCFAKTLSVPEIHSFARFPQLQGLL
jgi:hypothetical protein